MDAAMALNMSCAIVFVDVVNAFASLLRRIVFDFDGGDEAWLHQLRATGFSDADITAIYDSIRLYDWRVHFDDSATGGSAKSQFMSFRLAEQVYSHSWVSQEYLNHVIRVTSGSSAGYPLADLVYSLAMARVLTCLRSTLANAELQSSIRVGNLDMVARDASYVDDMAQPVLSSAPTLSHKVEQTVIKIFEVYSTFHLGVNFRPGKTECIINLVGMGSRGARVKLLSDGSRVPLPTIGADVYLNVVESYKHVGTQCSVSSDVKHEVTTRLSIMNTESRSLRKVLRKADSSITRKIYVLQAYIISKGLFQAGTWPALPPLQYKRLHTCILQLYRDITGQYMRNSHDIGNIFNNADLIFEYGLMCPMTMLRFFRMSLFARLVRKQPPHLLALVRELALKPKTWASSVLDDLRWLNNGSFWGHARVSSFDALYRLVADSPKAFARNVKSYCKRPFANMAAEVPEKRSLLHLGSQLACHYCGHSCHSLQQLNLHMFKAHQVRNLMRLYVRGTHCEVCLKEFHSRERALNHVRYRSAACRANLLFRGPVLSDDEASTLEGHERERNVALARAGKRRHHASTPAVQLQGPLLPILLLGDGLGNHHPLGIGHSYLPS